MSEQHPEEVQRTQAEAARLIALYETAEAEILAQIATGLSRGRDIKYLTTMRDNVREILMAVRSESKRWAEESIPEAYVIGADNAESDLRRAGAGRITTGFGDIHRQAVEILAENAYQRLDHTAQIIGRRTDDIYRRMALEASRGSTVGYRTYQQAADKFEHDLAERGITGFTDSAGRPWNMKTYSKMVAVTTTMEANIEGTSNRLIENGRDLVRVSQNGSSHQTCRVWEGVVLSLTGRSKGYRTLAEARASGLLHPNCKHTVRLFWSIDNEIGRLERIVGE